MDVSFCRSRYLVAIQATLNISTHQLMAHPVRIQSQSKFLVEINLHMAALDRQLTLQRSATASLTYMESEVNFHNRMNVFSQNLFKKVIYLTLRLSTQCCAHKGR